MEGSILSSGEFWKVAALVVAFILGIGMTVLLMRSQKRAAGTSRRAEIAKLRASAECYRKNAKTARHAARQDLFDKLASDCEKEATRLEALLR